MPSSLLRLAVRTLLVTTSRARANRQCSAHADRYLALAAELDEVDGRRPVRVPAQPGVDEDMREWSFYQLLDHNLRVNRSITATVYQLVHEEPPSGDGAIDPQTDVMPAPDPGPEQVQAFADSVQQHLDTVAELGRLRGTATRRHPLFGPFDAHRWHAMFALHLKIHLRQAEQVQRGAWTALDQAEA